MEHRDEEALLLRGVADATYNAVNALVASARRGELKRAVRTLRWIEAGTGEPVVVLGAGAGEPASLAWAATLPALATGTRVIAYDRAGIGASDPAPQLSLEQELDDLAAIVAASSGPIPCVLVGHSWGGLLALLVAMLHPDAVCGLVLVDPADECYWRSLPSKALRKDEELGHTLIEQHASGVLKATIREMCRPFVQRITAEPATQRLFLDAYTSCYSTASQASMFLNESRMSLASIAQIGAIRAARRLSDIPVVVLSASGGPPAAQRRAWTSAQAMVAASSRLGTHTVVRDTGHSIHQERPLEVTAAILSVVNDARAIRAL